MRHLPSSFKNIVCPLRPVCVFRLHLIVQRESRTAYCRGKLYVWDARSHACGLGVLNLCQAQQHSARQISYRSSRSPALGAALRLCRPCVQVYPCPGCWVLKCWHTERWMTRDDQGWGTTGWQRGRGGTVQAGVRWPNQCRTRGDQSPTDVTPTLRLLQQPTTCGTSQKLHENY